MLAKYFLLALGACLVVVGIAGILVTNKKDRQGIVDNYIFSEQKMPMCMYRFTPQKDITTWELAMVSENYLNQTYKAKDAPPEMMRHFKKDNEPCEERK